MVIQQIVAFDGYVANLIENSTALDWFFWIVSLSVILVIIFSAFYFFFVRKDKDMAGRVVIGSVVLYLIVELIKRFILRTRPNALDDFSFPSNHTAIAFALAMLLPVKKKYKTLLFVWAILVAVSRLVLQEHWFSDVIVGAGIGIIFGYFLSKYKRKIKI